MVKVNLMAFRDQKRQRCSLCNQTKDVSYLALFHEQGMICGDLILCEVCAQVMESALMHGATVKELDLTPAVS